MDRLIPEPFIIAVDFDGTIVENEWPFIGTPRREVIKLLVELRSVPEIRLILWTNRTRERLSEAVSFCRSEGIYFDAINTNLPEIVGKYGGYSRKISADMYLDDKAVRAGCAGCLELLSEVLNNYKKRGITNEPGT